MSSRARQDRGRHAAVLLALMLAGCQTLPVELDEKPGITRVYERYRSTSQVERVGQTFFGDEPEQGSDLVLRSDASSRVGYEFDVVLAGSTEVPAGAAFRLEVVRKEGEPAEVRTFPITGRPGWFFGEYALRLTGADDHGSSWRPVAWRISLVGPDGAVIAARRSFLWGAPTDEAR